MKKLMIAALAMLAFGAMDVSAQSETGNATVTVPEVLAITVDQTTIAFPNATAGDFTTGYVDAGTQSVIDTRGNVVHDLTINANNGTFGFTPSGGAADPNKPASDLQWSTGSGYTGLTTSQADVATALTRGVNTGAATVSYRILLDLTADVPGDYSLGFTYTVVAN